VLARDLATLADTAAAFDVPIVFISYPFELDREIDETIVAAAGKAGVPIVVSRRDWMRARRDGNPAESLFVHGMGPHPSGLLYRYVAETLASLLAPVIDGNESRATSKRTRPSS
jgi:hypothetical protein